MTRRVLIVGGYGNFGRVMSTRLAKEASLQIIIGGRSRMKAEELAHRLDAVHTPEAISLDIGQGFKESLASIAPDILIHTSGPFQEQDYQVAEACIQQGCHYIDIADGRAFVPGISALNAAARQRGVLVVSGASSVPCLTSALVDHYRREFQVLKRLDYGIATAQKTARGLATTTAILGYTGRAFKTLIDGQMRNVYGWQGLHRRKYQHLGRRFLGNCDVPDLALFPQRYPELQTIRFYAGLEIPLIHLTLWAISWLVRLGLIRKLEKAAPLLLKTARLFDSLGTTDSALHSVPAACCFGYAASGRPGSYVGLSLSAEPQDS